MAYCPIGLHVLSLLHKISTYEAAFSFALLRFAHTFGHVWACITTIYTTYI